MFVQEISDVCFSAKWNVVGSILVTFEKETQCRHRLLHAPDLEELISTLIVSTPNWIMWSPVFVGYFAEVLRLCMRNLWILVWKYV